MRRQQGEEELVISEATTVIAQLSAVGLWHELKVLEQPCEAVGCEVVCGVVGPERCQRGIRLVCVGLVMVQMVDRLRSREEAWWCGGHPCATVQPHLLRTMMSAEMCGSSSS